MTRRITSHRLRRSGTLARTTFLTLFAVIVTSVALFAVTSVWTRTVNGPANEVDGGLGTALAPNGDLYVVGYKSVSSLDSKMWIRKYNPTGSTKWTRSVDGSGAGYDFARGAVVDSAGNLYVVGQIFTSSVEKGDIWVRKYNSSGAKLWTRTVNGPGDSYDSAYAAAVDSADNVYVVGHVWSSTGGNDIWVRKYSSSGAKRWTRTVNGPGNNFDRAQGVAVDSADNIYVVGYVLVSGEGNNIWIRKYKPTGKKLWTRIVDGSVSGWDEAHAVVVDSSNNIFVAGSMTFSGEDRDIWVRKYNSAGTKLWTRTVSGSANDVDEAWGVAVDSNNAIYVIGEKELTGGKDVVWVRKYSSAGATRWTTTYGGPEDYAHGYAIAVNSTNRIYAVGDVLKPPNNNDIWVRKYQQ